MNEFNDGMVTPDNDEGRVHSRRNMLKGAVVGAGAIWVAPAITSFATPAAAGTSPQSSPQLTLWKYPNQNQPTDAQVCVSGFVSTASRGWVIFTRTPGSPDTITAQIHLSTGQPVTGRSIVIMQSDGTNCLNTLTVTSHTWGPSQTDNSYTDPIVAGANTFSMIFKVSGGGGNESAATPTAFLP